ncbi:hypothetical protein Hanom_Chr14g01258051 [Helianthus anomalus]
MIAIGSIVLYFWTIEISTSFIAHVKQEIGVQYLLMIMLTNMINFVHSLIFDNCF